MIWYKCPAAIIGAIKIIWKGSCRRYLRDIWPPRFGWYLCLTTTFGECQFRSEGSLLMLSNLNGATNRPQGVRDKRMVVLQLR